MQIEPHFVEIEEGNSVTLHCKGDGPVKWHFSAHNQTPPSPPSVFSENFHVNLVSSINDGYYYCYGKLPDNEKHFLSVAQIKVYGKEMGCCNISKKHYLSIWY